ncbi:MAG: septum formation family protein [Microthrixaceae bacterium]|nr:septum formation family protein [Microthrixaceae bacterium]
MTRSRVRAGLAVMVGTAIGVGAAACGGGDDPAPPTTEVTTTTEAGPTDRDLSQPAEDAVPGGAENLQAGDCYDPAPDPSQRDIMVLLVPCETPHQYEVYAVDSFNETRSAGYPGDDAVRNFAEERCFEAFEGFVGQVWRDSELDIETWYPTSASWRLGGDRKLSCVLFHRNGADLTGSMEGSAF